MSVHTVSTARPTNTHRHADQEDEQGLAVLQAPHSISTAYMLCCHRQRSWLTRTWQLTHLQACWCILQSNYS
jgi:hypothetical protein